jgi:nicotinamide-nucleotide amidase
MVSNAGRVVKGGIVCYAVEVKERLLDISPALIEQFTAESAEVTRELAVRLRAVIPADITVAVTGLPEAGGSETPEKPVGTMFIHIVSRGKETAMREVYPGAPEEIILKTIDRVAGSVLAELRASRSLTMDMLGIHA